jgi:hypothetical protein
MTSSCRPSKRKWQSFERQETELRKKGWEEREAQLQGSADGYKFAH